MPIPVGVEPENTTQRGVDVRKHALLVGISKYNRGRTNDQDWWDLHATNDIDAMAQVLKDRFQFKEDEIVLLRDENARRQDILGAFDKLIRETKEGDVIYFHYSGHGQQVPDDAGEEIDGWAQSIIPFDYKSRIDPSQNIRNREFRKLIANLKAKKPSNVTFVFDCCFSGEITKGGEELIRGEAWRGTPPAPKEPAKVRYAKGPVGIFPPRAAKAEGYVMIGACRNDQVAAETTDDNGMKMGLLTYALIHALQTAKPQETDIPSVVGAQTTRGGTTYRDLFEQIKDVVARRNRRQDAQLEGELDQLLMSGVVVKPEKFIEVSVPDEDSATTLRAGSLQGVTRGSLYALYPSNTKDFKNTQPLVEATVQDTKLGTATLQLTKEFQGKVKKTDLHHSRAVESQHVYGDNLLKVDISQLEKYHPKAELMANRLRKLDVLSPAKGTDDLDVRVVCRGKDEKIDRLIEGLKNVPEKTPWLVVRRDGSIIGAFPDDDNLPDRIGYALQDEARWRTIMGLDNHGTADPFKVEIRAIPIEVTRGPDGLATGWVRDKKMPQTDGNRLLLDEGEFIMIEIRVDKDAPYDPFVSILDLWPDGRVGLLWPLDEKEEKTKIKADGDWHRLLFPNVWRLTLPRKPRYGGGTYNTSGRAEVFKVFATQTYVPMDLLTDPTTARGLRGQKIKGVEPKGGPLAEIIRAAVAGQRAERASVAPEYWSTSTLHIDIGSEP